MIKFNRAAILGLCMLAASVAPAALRWGGQHAERPSAIDLDTVVPREFGAWRERPAIAQVVDPQSKELIDKLYRQVLSRTYVDDRGNFVMLTIAYGNDQRGSLEVHRPEVCYPAQGFTVGPTASGDLNTRYGAITVRRLDTSLGTRKEPVTYWTTIGTSVVEGRIQKRVVELNAALTGKVPDGMLVRVSSLDSDPARAWRVQAEFVDALVHSMSPDARLRVAGLRSTPAQ